jgi:hypothetical protein
MEVKSRRCLFLLHSLKASLYSDRERYYSDIFFIEENYTPPSTLRLMEGHIHLFRKRCHGACQAHREGREMTVEMTVIPLNTPE